MLTWLIASALAAPLLGVHLTGGVGQQAREVSPWLGGGLSAFAPASQHIELGGRAEVGYTGALSAALTPQVRLQPLLTDGPTLDLVGGAGVLWHERLRPVVTLGAGTAIPLGQAPLRLRVEGTWMASPTTGPTRFLLHLGIESRRRAAPAHTPVEPQAPELVSPPPSATVVPQPPAEPPSSAAPPPMVTVAWPECQVVTETKAKELLAAAPPNERVVVRVGEGAAIAGSAAELAASLPTPSDQGSLLVAAWPGDAITVAGRTLAVASDGFALVQLHEDAHEVTVTGGGRSYTVEIAIAAEHGTWVRAPEPAPVRFGFEVNRATLTAADQAKLRRFANNAGDWSFTVQGGYSPEGDLQRNLDLARRRAAAAVNVLRTAGIDPERITVLEPMPPDPALSAVLQRKTVVTPVKEDP